MGQIASFSQNKKRNTGDKSSSISSPSEPSCEYDETLIDKMLSASYGAGLDLKQSQISGSVQSEEPLTTKDYYLGLTAAKSSLTTGVGLDETDENAIDKVSSASYAAGIQLEKEEEVGDSERENSIARTSAPAELSREEAEAHAKILSDEAALEKLARDYMHPELPVTVTDPTATARCYFDRASAPVQQSKEEAEAHAQILLDEAALEKLVRDYMHPELPVTVTDPTATARCYFDRASACTYATEKSDTFFSNRVKRDASTDPFDLDEDVLPLGDATDMISSPSTQEMNESPKSKPIEEGKLSRSPSCVRLI